MLSLTQEEIMDKLERILLSDDTIVVAYLFGSIAREEVNFQSDLDVALYLSSPLQDEERFGYLSTVIDKVGKEFSHDYIDIVVLDDNVPYFLAYNIIKQGKVIFSRNRTIQAQLESLIIRRYLDFEHYSEVYNKCLLKRWKKK